jgi:hypothetical protein
MLLVEYFTLVSNYTKSHIAYTDRLVNRMAPGTSAKDRWRNRVDNPIRADELPLLRASSDYALGFWNQENPTNLQNIQKIMSLTIVIRETMDIINRALGNIKQAPGEPKIARLKVWPGTTFVVHGDSDAMALLGMHNILSNDLLVHLTNRC